MGMETKPNPLVDGMKHSMNLMLSFASWEKTKVVTPFFNIWFLVHNMLAVMLNLCFKSS